jgi:hypothetical protein
MNSGNLGRPPRSAGAHSVEGSEVGSVLDEEYTTALPRFDNTIKEKKDRGLRGVLPFPRKKKDKDKDKEKDKDKDKDKHKEKEEKKGKERDHNFMRSQERITDRGGSSLGDYNLSLRNRPSQREARSEISNDW